MYIMLLQHEATTCLSRCSLVLAAAWTTAIKETSLVV